MNILITGANGQLGSCIRLLGEKSTNNYIYTDVAELDITDEKAIREFFHNNRIDVIVNCAAYTNVEKAEDEKVLVDLINVKAVENLAIVAKENEATLIHISTDYVFDGNQSYPYTEEDIPNITTGNYAISKMNSERAIEKIDCNHIVIRTAWLYSEFGGNFVKTMLRLTSEKDNLKVVFDQVGTPTYAGDLAEAIFEIIEDQKYENNFGIYHYSNEGVCSWYDFAQIIAELAGNTNCNIQPCRSTEFTSKVVRPSYSILDKTKIKNTFGISIPYWSDSLKKCIENLKTN